MHGQNSLLERDINKRDSLAGRRRDSTVEKSSKMFDPQKPKGPAFSLVRHMFAETVVTTYYLRRAYSFCRQLIVARKKNV